MPTRKSRPSERKQPSRSGRPRDPAADRAIIAATLELLSEAGYEGIRVDDVAELAGVSKTTMYRRWPSKDDLILAALWDSPPLEVVDTGSLIDDLTKLMSDFVSLTQKLPIIELLASLAAQRQRNPSLGHELDPFIAERMRPLAQAFQHAIARGEMSAEAPLAEAGSLLGGSILLRLLSGGATDPETIRRLATIVVEGSNQPPRVGTPKKRRR